MTMKYPAYQFALFRMIFGLYLLVHFLYLIPVAGELWSSAGFISDVKLNPSYGFFPNMLYVWSTPLASSDSICVCDGIAFFFCDDRVLPTNSECVALVWMGLSISSK